MQLKILDVFDWRLENQAKYLDPEATYATLLKIELNAIAQNLADRLYAFVKGCAAETGNDSAEYGAKAAMGLWSLVIQERCNDANDYFVWPEEWVNQ